LERLQRGQDPFEKLADSVQEFGNKVQIVTGAWSAAFDQAQTNAEIRIENEYKTRLAAINKNVKDEAKRQAAIQTLEAEFEIKRTEARRAAAKQQKAVAFFDATVNVAEAVTKALTAAIPPWNFILAAMVSAAGAVQLGLIASQPIPLAQGTVFKKRTRFTTEAGVTYETEDREPEIVSPKSIIKQAVYEAMGDTGSRNQGLAINISGPLFVSNAALTDAEVRRKSRIIFQVMKEEIRSQGFQRLVNG